MDIQISTQEQNNIDKIISRYGNDYILYPRTKHMAYNCPFCLKERGKPDSDHKFSIRYDTGMYNCFKCHVHGRLFSAKISPSENILNKFNLLHPEVVELPKSNDCKLLPLKGVVDVSKSSIAWQYLQRRGVTKDKVLYYNLKDGISDEFFGRVLIPNNYVISWTDFYQGRSYLGSMPKYVNPRNVDKSNIVFNLHNQKVGQKNVYIVEGAFSAILAGTDVISIYGSAISDVQTKLISSYKFENIYCCLDGDSAGRNGQLKMINKLLKNTDSNVYDVRLPENEDPADMGELRFKEYCELNKTLVINTNYYNLLSYFK